MLLSRTWDSRTRTWAGINTHISCRHRARSHVISCILSLHVTDNQRSALDSGILPLLYSQGRYAHACPNSSTWKSWLRHWLKRGEVRSGNDKMSRHRCVRTWKILPTIEHLLRAPIVCYLQQDRTEFISVLIIFRVANKSDQIHICLEICSSLYRIVDKFSLSDIFKFVAWALGYEERRRWACPYN